MMAGGVFCSRCGARNLEVAGVCFRCGELLLNGAPAKHSWFGILSCGVSAFVGMTLFTLFVITRLVERVDPGMFDEFSLVTFLFALVLIGSLFMLMIGLGLGIAGFSRRDRKPLTPIIGIICNSFFLGIVSLALFTLLLG